MQTKGYLTPELSLYWTPDAQSWVGTHIFRFIIEQSGVWGLIAVSAAMLIVALLLQYAIGYAFTKDKTIALLSSVILAISPLGVSGISQKPEMILAVIALQALIFSIQRRYSLLTMLFLVLTLMLPGLYIFCISLLAISYLLIMNKKNWNLIGFSIIILLYSLFSLLLFQNIPSLNTSLFHWVFSEWGIVGGITLLGATLSLSAAVINWKRMHKQALMLLLFVLILTLAFPQITFLLWPLVALSSSWMIIAMYSYKWNTPSYKWVLLIIVFLGLVWSYGAISWEVVHQVPQDDQVQAFDFIQTLDSGTIILPSQLTPLVYAHSNLTTFPSSPTNRDQILLSNAIYNTTSLREINDEFLRLNITYIWLPKQDYQIDLRYALNVDKAFEKNL